MNNNINWNQLRDEFFKECTYKPSGDVPHVALTPHDLFEWFRSKLDHLPEAGKMMPENRHDTTQVGFPKINQNRIGKATSNSPWGSLDLLLGNKSTIINK